MKKILKKTEIAEEVWEAYKEGYLDAAQSWPEDIKHLRVQGVAYDYQNSKCKRKHEPDKSRNSI